MAHQIHRVKSSPKPPPLLPKDVWQGRTFIESDGTVCEVIYSGRHMPQTDVQQGRYRGRTQGHPVVKP
jgi:hypothetical protein